MDCRCGGRNASARVTWYAFSSALFTFLINCLCSALRRLGLPKEAGNTYTISASLSPLAITFQTRITEECSLAGGREWKGVEKGHTNEDGLAI